MRACADPCAVRWCGYWSAVLVLVSCADGRLCTGQGDQLAPGMGLGSLVVLWELVTHDQ